MALSSGSAVVACIARGCQQCILQMHQRRQVSILLEADQGGVGVLQRNGIAPQSRDGALLQVVPGHAVRRNGKHRRGPDYVHAGVD